MLYKKPTSPQQRSHNETESSAKLSNLPYDLLLNIATYLDLRDVHALHLVSRLTFLFSGREYLDDRYYSGGGSYELTARALSQEIFFNDPLWLKENFTDRRCQLHLYTFASLPGLQTQVNTPDHIS